MMLAPKSDSLTEVMCNVLCVGVVLMVMLLDWNAPPLIVQLNSVGLEESIMQWSIIGVSNLATMGERARLRPGATR